MVKYTIGEIIRRERRKQKLSQEALSDGICTPSWLSKIESGACIPTPALFETLMQRLSKDHSHYVTYLNELHIRIEHLKIEIRKAHRLRNFEKASSLYRELEYIARMDHPEDGQFLLYYQLLLFNAKDLTPPERLPVLNRALCMTREAIALSKIDQYLLSQDEIQIIDSIACCHKEIGHTSKGIDLLNKLRLYLENPRFDYEEKLRSYPHMMCTLANWLNAEGDFSGSLDISKAALEFCIQYDKLLILPELLCAQGRSLLGLGNDTEAVSCFKRAYYILCAAKNRSEAKQLFELCEAEFGLTILNS